MGRKRKTPDLNSKIAGIGEFVKPKEEEEKIKVEKKRKKEEKVEEETEETKEEEVKEEEPITKEQTPEQIKEKIVKLVSEVASRGLTEKEKKKFLDDFNFWNGTLFEILDIGNNLKTILGQTSITLTPGQALIGYLVGTGALMILLRPDLQARLFKQKPLEKKPDKENLKEELPIVEIVEEEKI